MNATIIIPVFNAWEHTERCLDSLMPTLEANIDRGWEVIVVDNGSTDGTFAGLGDFNQQLWIRWIGRNSGFARACNLGASDACAGPGPQPDVLVFLNNDTILFPGWLDELLAPFDDYRVGATGPMSNWVSGEQLIPAGPWRAAEGEDEDLAAGAAQWMADWKGGVTQTERLVGFCMAVRASAFREVGGFDEQFEIGGCEDDDLCKSLTKAGYKLKIARGSFVYHHGHATFSANDIDMMSQQFANQQKFAAKWGGEFAGPFQP